MIISPTSSFSSWTQKEGTVTEDDLVIDQGNEISLLHLLAVFLNRDDQRTLSCKKWHKIDHWNPPKPPPKTIEAEISFLQLVLLRTPKELIELEDNQEDTPLHYACAARQLHNIKAFLSFGANPNLKNRLGLTAVEILAWSVISWGKTIGFSYHFDDPQLGNVKEYNYLGSLVEERPPNHLRRTSNRHSPCSKSMDLQLMSDCITSP